MKISTCSDRPILVPCGLNDFEHQIDPYVGCEHYCYYCYVLDQAETDWTKEILIHADVAARLGGELEGLKPQTIYMGYHTDPYQPCESELRQTRQVLELLLERGFSASILTKSDLVLRDTDVLREMAHSNVSVSVAFNEERVRRLFEANTIATQRRIEALRKLREVGVSTSAMVCPVIPHITDAMAIVGEVAPHSDVVWVYGLSVQMPTQRCWGNVQDVLSRNFAELKEDIESAVLDSGHPFWSDLRKSLEDVKESIASDLRIHV